MVESIDYNKLTEKLGGRKVARQVCRIFLEELPGLMDEYRESLPSLQAVARSAHRLKGSLGMLEGSLMRLAGRLERACLQGERELALTLHHRLDQGLQELRKDLETFVRETPRGR